jgi:Helix-turn-helix domain
MEQQNGSVPKTFKYKLMPTPAQEQALERVLSHCRTLCNTALGERKTAWERGSVSISYYQQEAELPDVKAACPQYAEVNAQAVQDVIQRVERASRAFFRRLTVGQQPGYPRFQGRNRYNSFTYPHYGVHAGAMLDGGVLSLSKIGRISICLHRPLRGIPKTVTISREADGWYAYISCAQVPTEPLPLTGRETGIDVGLKVFLITADGEIVTLPMAKAKGLLGPANETELLAGCPPELLGTKVPRYLETSKRTAHVLPDGRFSVGTPRTRDGLCTCTGRAATKPGFIAQANGASIAQTFDASKRTGPFIPVPKGRGPLAPGW